jgi:hypothetical protein
MARSVFNAPPPELREKLGHDGYEYLTRLHEHLYQGGANGTGQLELENLNATMGDGDVRMLRGGPDGKLTFGQLALEETVANSEGIVQVSGKKPKAGPLNAEKLVTDEKTPRRTFRTTGDGKIAFEDGLESRVGNAASFPPQEAHPTPPDAEKDVTQYTKNGYLIFQHKTYNPNPEPIPGTREYLPPGYRERYVYRDMRDPLGEFVTALAPPPERADPTPMPTSDKDTSEGPKGNTEKPGTEVRMPKAASLVLDDPQPQYVVKGRDHSIQLHQEIFS